MRVIIQTWKGDKITSIPVLRWLFPRNNIFFEEIILSFFVKSHTKSWKNANLFLAHGSNLNIFASTHSTCVVNWEFQRGILKDLLPPSTKVKRAFSAWFAGGLARLCIRFAAYNPFSAYILRAYKPFSAYILRAPPWPLKDPPPENSKDHFRPPRQEAGSVLLAPRAICRAFWPFWRLMDRLLQVYGLVSLMYTMRERWRRERDNLRGSEVNLLDFSLFWPQSKHSIHKY